MFIFNILAEKVVMLRKSVSINDDVISFINLNWDLLLDNAINSKSNTLFEDKNKTALDYCFYTDSFENEPDHIPHIRLKAKNFKNIKILKPHGSFNWLVCMNCGKVFIKFNDKIALYEYIEKRKCNKCKKESLKAVIKTPTLLKDFDNVHLNDILHNIEIELFEAKRVIFIGYSLPLADIELRYIFKRCINKDAIVQVVLWDQDQRYSNTIKMYKTFFGNQFEETPFQGKGSVNFFKHEFHFTYD